MLSEMDQDGTQVPSSSTGATGDSSSGAGVEPGSENPGSSAGAPSAAMEIDLTADESEPAPQFFDADSVLRDVDAALNADTVGSPPIQLEESG